MTSTAPVSRVARLRRPLALVLACALGLLAARCGEHQPVLAVYVWTGYVPTEVYERFEAETGARVIEMNFASNEELRAKLVAGAEGYDVVCPTDYMVRLLVRDGLLLPLDQALLPGLDAIAPRFRDPPYDPGHAHSVPFAWGVSGIAYDRDVVTERPSSWSDLLDPERHAAHAGRISMLNDPRELVSAALLALGHDPNATDPAALTAAGDLLLRQKPSVAKYDSDTFGESLVAGEIVMAHAWSGTIAGAQAERPSLAFTVPSEGALMYVDNWAVPRATRQPELAQRFVAFCLRPEIAALIAENTGYASCNAAAVARLPMPSRVAYSDGGGAPLRFLADAGDGATAIEDIWKRLKAE